MCQIPIWQCDVSLFHRCLASEGIVTLGVTLSHCVCVRRNSRGVGNALYPVLCGLYCMHLMYRFAFTECFLAVAAVWFFGVTVNAS